MAKTNLKIKEDSFIKSFDYLISKITFKENKAIIECLNDDDFKTNEFKFKVKDEVTNDFKEKFQKAKAAILELTPTLKEEHKALFVTQIEFKYDNVFDLESVKISADWVFDNQLHVLPLKYPDIPIYKPTMAENIVAISGIHEKILYDILKAAKAYMNGDTRTKQMKLVVDNG